MCLFPDGLSHSNGPCAGSSAISCELSRHKFYCAKNSRAIAFFQSQKVSP